MKGVKTVTESLMHCGQAIQPRLLEDLILKSPETRSTDIETPPLRDLPTAKGESDGMLLYISRTKTARFATLRFANSQGWLGLDGAEPNILSTAIDSLSDITELVRTGRYTSLFRILISWITNLDTAVVQLMTDAHPGVLAIYTHWLMLLIVAEELWWIGDMGRAGIRDVLHVIGSLQTTDLAPVLSWPQEVLDMQ